jgi:hypothetical protein
VRVIEHRRRAAAVAAERVCYAPTSSYFSPSADMPAPGRSMDPLLQIGATASLRRANLSDSSIRKRGK